MENMKKGLALAIMAGFLLSGSVASANGDSSQTSCTPHTLEVMSDTSNTVGSGNAVALTPIHSAWTASIPGATWIWSSNPVVSPTTVDDTKTFEKVFTVVGNPLSATLDIATDNFYRVWVNGVLVGEQQVDENSFQLGTQDNYPTVSGIVTGSNTIKVEVRNKALNGSNPESNPAGLLYKLVVNSEECCNTTPNCCGGDVTVTNTNNATVINNVSVGANTGGNATLGGAGGNGGTTGKTKAKNSSTANGGNANGGNGGTNSGDISTGTAKAKSKISSTVNTNITRIRR